MIIQILVGLLQLNWYCIDYLSQETHSFLKFPFYPTHNLALLGVCRIAFYWTLSINRRGLISGIEKGIDLTAHCRRRLINLFSSPHGTTHIKNRGLCVIHGHLISHDKGCSMQLKRPLVIEGRTSNRLLRGLLWTIVSSPRRAHLSWYP